jgi:hypothetical protein
MTATKCGFRAVLLAAAMVVAAGVLLAAEELTVTEGWVYVKNGRSRSLGTTSSRETVAGDGVLDNVQTVSTNAAGDDLILGGVTTAGYAWFKNLGISGAIPTNSAPTNRIYIGRLDSATNFSAFLDLNTNQAAMVFLATTNLRARAVGTNSVRLEYMVIDR